MAFDPKSHQLLLFGGENSSSLLDDTWRWTGSTWLRLHPRNAPPASIDQSLAYDPTDGGLLLFGGLRVTSGGPLAPLGTWLWTGSDWTQLFPTESPPLRSAASVCWVPSAKVVVLFGGIDAQSARLSDTWIWTGKTWQLARVARFPEPRSAGDQFAYDQKTHVCVLFGGFKGSGLPEDGDTWTLKLGS